MGENCMIYETAEEQGFSDFYYSAHQINYFSEPHVHSHMEFVFVLRGNLLLSIGENEFSVPEGNLAILLPYEVHKYQSPLPSECFILACPPEYIPEYRQILRDQAFSPPVAPYGAGTAALLPEMIKACTSDGLVELGQQSSFKKKALLYCVLSDLLCSSFLEKRPASDLDLYRNAILYISHHYTQKLDLSTVAPKMGVSDSHLSRILSSKGGLGFSDLLNSLRSYEARRLLLQTDLSISQIALEAGFGSIRNFNRGFQKQFHCMPNVFRKSS